jgi:hypothetical protein
MKGVERERAWVHAEQQLGLRNVTEVLPGPSLEKVFVKKSSVCQKLTTVFAVEQRASGEDELYKISFC